MSESIREAIQVQLDDALECLRLITVERNAYMAALQRIESHGAGYAVVIARAALEGDQ